MVSTTPDCNITIDCNITNEKKEYLVGRGDETMVSTTLDCNITNGR